MADAFCRVTITAHTTALKMEDLDLGSGHTVYRRTSLIDMH